MPVWNLLNALFLYRIHKTFRNLYWIYTNIWRYNHRRYHTLVQFQILLDISIDLFSIQKERSKIYDQTWSCFLSLGRTFRLASFLNPWKVWCQSTLPYLFIAFPTMNSVALFYLILFYQNISIFYKIYKDKV